MFDFVIGSKPAARRVKFDDYPPGGSVPANPGKGGDFQMPAKSEKQRKFMGAELERKREGKKTKTGMSEKELEKYASKKKD